MVTKIIDVYKDGNKILSKVTAKEIMYELKVSYKTIMNGVNHRKIMSGYKFVEVTNA